MCGQATVSRKDLFWHFTLVVFSKQPQAHCFPDVMCSGNTEWSLRTGVGELGVCPGAVSHDFNARSL